MDDPLRLMDHLAGLDDPRNGPATRHLLIDIVVVAICAVICGAGSWRDIEAYGLMKQSWFQTFLALPNGIPSHDTFARVFARIDPQRFQECFLSWISAVGQLTKGKLVAIDGKTLRRSFDKAAGKAALHLVSAWCSKNQLVLGQVKVDAKSNEITAIPRLLELLDIKGCTVTIDAAGCQRAIAAKIVEKGGDYLLGLKGNQPGLHDPVRMIFDGAATEALNSSLGQAFVTVEKDHGRLEIRRYWLASNLSVIGDQIADWSGLKALGIAERETEQGDTRTFERRYFILSTLPSVADFAVAVRGHWGIENSLHWSMDVLFREDDSRIRKDRAAENFAILRRIALSLTKRARYFRQGNGREARKEKKFSTRTKRLMAGWDEGFLLEVLFGTPDASAAGVP